MDISKEYIQMCEAAEEIQIAMPNNDVVLTSAGQHETMVFADIKKSFGEDKIEGGYIRKAKSTWLPRQDQLQEILSKKYHSMDGQCEVFSWVLQRSRLTNSHNTTFGFNNTFEKVWLMTVMREVYGKIWVATKNKWVVIK